MLNKKNTALILVFIAGMIPLFDLFHSGFPITHDGQDHIARIANFYQNLIDGNLVPRWAPNLNWGYGHPILMFLYPFSSYITSFFHFLGFSLIDSIKIFFGFSFIFSGITMYMWLRETFDDYIAITGAVLYLYAPYRFVDLYVRGAIGEHAAFIFPPLVLYFLLKLSKKYSFRYFIGGLLAFAGLILSHNAISLMFMPIIIFYAIYLILSSKFKKDLALNIFYLMLLGFGISSFFWIPSFFEGKYTLRNIVTAGGYVSHFVQPFDLIYGKWNYGASGQFTVQVGILNLIVLLSSISLLFHFFKNKDRKFYLIFIFLGYSLIVIFLILSYSNFIWQKIMILQNFQFPWRFLSVLVFTTAFLGSALINVFPQRIKLIFAIFLITASIFLTKDYWHAKGYSQKQESFFTGIYYSTTDTGESAPIWSVRFMEKTPKAEIEIIDGKATIEKLKRNSTEHNYKIVAFDRARIRENTLYFPGWNVFVNGKQVNVQFQDPKNRGLITFFVEKGENIISLRFRETRLRYLANALSILSLGILAALGIIRINIFKLWRTFR